MNSTETSNTNPESIGTALKQWRESTNTSRQKAAQVIGCNLATIINWEERDAKPRTYMGTDYYARVQALIAGKPIYPIPPVAKILPAKADRSRYLAAIEKLINHRQPGGLGPVIRTDQWFLEARQHALLHKQAHEAVNHSQWEEFEIYFRMLESAADAMHKLLPGCSQCGYKPEREYGDLTLTDDPPEDYQI